MTIQIFNSMGRKKEPLICREPGKVGLYVCGVTVYDYSHIGHARVMVVFDAIVRHLRARGLAVTYVRNYTDIDDKIIQRANELGISIGTLTEKYIQAFQEDMAALGMAPPDIEPKATEHLAEMQTMIGQLIDNGLAYESGGDVYYAVDRFTKYGLLSGKNLADLVAGSRVDVNTQKRNPLDFVLWKGAKPGEPQWPSPWGPGRPGWHIECSAMSSKYLGNRFDIHGGGRDLIFPHHENEIAQSEGTTGHDWVRYWLHNGFVNVISDAGEREKMSKSLGNFFTIRDLLKAYRGEVLRVFILNNHYRSPLDFSFGLLNGARGGLDRLYSALEGAGKIIGVLPSAAPISPETEEGRPLASEVGKFFSAMDDDFNTPQAVAVLFEVVKKLNLILVQPDSEQKNGLVLEHVRVLRSLGAIIGMGQGEPVEHFQFQPEVNLSTLSSEGNSADDADLTVEQIEDWIEQRAQARVNRDYAESDRIRDLLADQGISVLDSKEGTTWRRN
ncbi:MAG: cysteine--tRNA ligase [Magnetococcales bacterium]|nr:cysteine--tRNA ligase [Magnetococcales bacterium]